MRNPISHQTPLLFALLSATALTPVTGWAQDSDSSQDSATAKTVTTLSPISVEGEDDDTSIVALSYGSGSKTETDVLDSSATVSVVTAKEMQERGVSSYEDALSYTAGLVADTWGGGDDRYDYFLIRGFSEITMGSYIDGLPERGFGWTYARREPYAYDRIEVLKGSNSSLFGLNAPGGMVNAVSKTPKDYKFGEAYTTLGENHTEMGTDFGDVLNKDGTLSYRVTAKVQRAHDELYDYSKDDRKFFQLSLKYAPTDATSLIFLATYNQRHGTPGNGVPDGSGLAPTTFVGEPDFNRLYTTEKSVGWMLDHDFGNGLSFHQVARYSRFDMDYEAVDLYSTDPTATRDAFAVYSDWEQAGIDNQLKYDSSIGNVDSTTLVGLEYTWIRENEHSYTGDVDPIDLTDITYGGLSAIGALSTYYNWIPELTTQAVYAQEQLTFNDRWIVTGGLRYDHVDMSVDNIGADTYTEQTWDNVSGRLGVTYKVTDNLSAYANFAQSFRPPTPFNLPGDPTEGTQYEAGVKWRPAGMNALFSASVFDLTESNILTQTSATTYETIGKVNVKGIELEAKGQVTPNFELSATYSHWDAEITEAGSVTGTEGNRPAYVPANIGSLWANYTLPASGARHQMSLGAGVRYVGQAWMDNANTIDSPSHTLVDLAASYDLTDDTTISLNVSNLFDKEYLTANYYGADMYGTGRLITATLRHTW